MIRCLSEGIKKIYRKALSAATLLSLRRDERKPFMDIRFSAAGRDFKHYQDFFGSEKAIGTGATNITEATERVLKRFCTEYPNTLNEKVYEHLFKHLRIIQRQQIIDSASDERLSTRQAAQGLRCDGVDPLFPNQDVETLDKAHGGTRLLSRTFTADPWMSQLLEDYVTGKQSFVSIVHNSTDINDKFEESLIFIFIVLFMFIFYIYL